MSSLDPLIGKTIAGFRLEQLLGEGGMGRVYLATQVRLKRHVAVKILPNQLVFKNRQFVDRFLREALTAAQLTHPNIVQVYDAGEFEGTFYIAMELVDGKGLDEIIKERKTIPVGQAVDIIIQAARGLAAASKKNLVHRDIKPGNLMITSEGIVKVADFGLAKNTEASHGLTDAGQVLGTPAFMSPEQGKGLPADHRSDIYSLGVTLFAMVTGTLPFQGETPVSIVLKHISEPPPDPCELNSSVPRELGDVILKVMEKEPEDRYSGADEFVAALETVRAQIPGARTIPPASGTVTGIKTGSLVSEETLADPGLLGKTPDWNAMKVPSTSGIEAGPHSRKGLVAALLVAIPLTAAAVLGLLFLLGVFDKPGGSGPEPGDGGSKPKPLENPVRFRILSPAPDSVLASSRVIVSGTIESGRIREIRVNGEEAVIKGREFTAEVSFQDGKRNVHVLLKGEEGDEQEALVPLTIDTSAPKLELDREPGAPVMVRADKATITGSARDDNPTSVSVNGVAVPLGPGGAFSFDARLVEGPNTLLFEARDEAGNASSLTLVLVKDTVSPTITLESFPERVESSSPDLTLAGRSDETLAEVRVNGSVVGRDCTAFSQALKLSPGKNPILVSGTDKAGNSTEKSFNVDYFALPAGMAAGSVPNTHVWEKDGARMARVPAGDSRMGGGERPEEGPERSVQLSGFWIDVEEVTNRRYALFLEALAAGTAGDVFHPDDPARQPSRASLDVDGFSDPDLPVTGVDWFSAYAYAKWAGKSLPTEAQWEKAAAWDEAASVRRRFAWGNAEPESSSANFGRRLGKPAPAGSHPADRSAAGCVDMAGNASEWCLDWFVPDFHARPESGAKDPVCTQQPKSGLRSVRGGSWRDVANWLRTSSRRGAPPVWTPEMLRSIGFRTVLNP